MNSNKKQKKKLSLFHFLTLSDSFNLEPMFGDVFNVTAGFNLLECLFQKLSQMCGSSFSGVACRSNYLAIVSSSRWPILAQISSVSHQEPHAPAEK